MGERTPEITEAIAYIDKNIYEPLPISDLAKHVGYSPYHFLRLFKSQTGLSPHYYISSHRLQKAKDLLLHTNLSVRDVALEIGQQSLGTFTTRFSKKVGVTPSQFRDQKMVGETHLQSLFALAKDGVSESFSDKSPTVVGNIQSQMPIDGVIFIGLFHKPIPESIPIYGTLLLSPGTFHFSNIKLGTYYLMATSISWDTYSSDILLPYTTLRTRDHKPITIRSHNQMIHTQITLYPPRIGDPPILISLPLLMNRFLNRMNRR